MKSDPHRAELFAIYAEVDALLAPFTCDSTTECCDFGLTGREPYPTAVELAEVERAMAAASIDTRGKRRRSLPVADGATARRCPAPFRSRALPHLRVAPLRLPHVLLRTRAGARAIARRRDPSPQPPRRRPLGPLRTA